MNLNDKKKEEEEKEEAERQKELQKKAEDEAASKALLEEAAQAAQGAEEEDEGMPEGPGFMALYTTLMLLLMTFFIVLCSMAKNSEGKFNEGKQSINSTFNVMGLSGSKEALFFMYSFLKIQNSAVKQALEVHGPITGSTEDKDKDRAEDKIFWEDGLSKDEASHLHRFISLGFNIDTSDKESKSVKVKFPYGGVFEEGTAEFKEVFSAILEPFLKLIGDEYAKLGINVFTIEKPASSTGLSTSLELAALRANAIASEIVTIQGVERSRLEPIGFGEYFADHSRIPTGKDAFVELVIYSLWGADVKEPVKEGEEGATKGA